MRLRRRSPHVLRQLWGGPETLIVVSSDLSHYHDYETARRLDAATATAIERGYGRLHATNATIENVQTASTKPNERIGLGGGDRSTTTR